ncbi:MAG: methyltransferase domain-containing protein [Candidatus Pacearchaeota archaeon]
MKIYKKFAEIYDKIMQEGFHRKYKQYYEFIIANAKRYGVSLNRMLDIACGTGKLAEMFRKKGYDIEGIDKSKNMLEIARQRGIKCYEADMAHFNLNKKYNLILCVFDSLNYLTKPNQIRKCFSCVSKHLEKGGLFIFDMNSDYKINSLLRNASTWYKKINNIELIWINSWKKDMWISKIIMFEKIKENIYKRYCEVHVEKAYSLAKIKKLLKETGFRIRGIYSSLNFDKIKKDSGRWFFVVQKTKF